MKTQYPQYLTSFGIVVWFDDAKNVGGIRVKDEPVEVSFSLDSQRAIVAGFDKPVFGVRVPKESPMPSSGAHVSVSFKIGYELSEESHRRTLSRVARATSWGHLFEYQDAKREIAARPVYRAVEFTLYKGRPTTQGQRRDITVGTAIQLQARYPRGKEGDPLASESRMMDFTYRRRFYLEEAGGKLIQVDDPRPLPAGVVAEVVSPVNEQGLLLTDRLQLTELVAAINASQRGHPPRVPGVVAA